MAVFLSTIVFILPGVIMIVYRQLKKVEKISKNMKKNSIIVIAIIVLLIIGALYYFVLLPGRKADGKISSISLEGFSQAAVIKGVELKPGDGIVTTTFRVSDLIAINAKAEVTAAKKLSAKIFDKKGEAMAGSIEFEIQNSGGFGACCLNSPTNSGSYVLKFFLDSKEVKKFPFEVLPQI